MWQLYVVLVFRAALSPTIKSMKVELTLELKKKLQAGRIFIADYCLLYLPPHKMLSNKY